jgi:hypothetical protein
MSEVTLAGPNTCHHNKQLQLPPLEQPEIVVLVLRFLNEIGDLGRTLTLCKLWNRATILSQRQISSQLLDLQDLCAGKTPIPKPIQLDDKIFLLPDLRIVRCVQNDLKKDALSALIAMKEEDFKTLECSYPYSIEPNFFHESLLFSMFSISLLKVIRTRFMMQENEERETLVISHAVQMSDCTTMLEFIEPSGWSVEISIDGKTLFDYAKIYQVLNQSYPGFFELLVELFSLIDDLKLEGAISLIQEKASQQPCLEIVYPILAGIWIYVGGVEKTACFLEELPYVLNSKLEVYAASAEWIFRFQNYRDHAIELINTLPSEHDRRTLFVKLLNGLDFTEAEEYRQKIETILQGLQIQQHLNQQFHAQEFDRLWKKEQLRKAKVRASWEADFCTLF